MIDLDIKTINLIRYELNQIPEKYQKPFNSNHEGYAVLLEEVRELEHAVFFGEKECKKIVDNGIVAESRMHINMIREEAIQVAAMACRIIQELT